MGHWDFISKPNNCTGCPIAKAAPLGSKVANICDKFITGYEVQYTLNDYGQQVCRVRKREVLS